MWVTQLIVKPAIRPARRSSCNPTWMERPWAGQVRTGGRGRAAGLTFGVDQDFCGFYWEISVSGKRIEHPYFSRNDHTLWSTQVFYEVVRRVVVQFLGLALWPWDKSGDKSLRGQSERPVADVDYAIKLLVNPVTRNRPKYQERCLKGYMLRIPWSCLENRHKHTHKQL